MQITIAGAGYVGLITGLCFTTAGHRVTFLESDENRRRLLERGVCPIYEPTADSYLKDAIAKNLVAFSGDAKKSIHGSDIIFIAVNTPGKSSGDADLSSFYTVIDEILPHIETDKVLIIKSTIPPGTTAEICSRVDKKLHDTGNLNKCRVLYNPEFLREGSACHDFFNPDRIILGTYNEEYAEPVIALYESLGFKRELIFITTPENAELTKYASNGFLAIKLTYINELAVLCEKTGAQITTVARLLGMDKRISSFFMNAGLGYGGSCLPKDTNALAYLASKMHSPIRVLESAIESNAGFYLRAAKKIYAHLPTGGIVSVYGLAFKSGSDDVRESTAVKLVKELIMRKRYCIRVFDELAMNNAKKELTRDMASEITWCSDYDGMLRNADALVLLTANGTIDLATAKLKMRGNYLFDFYNQVSKNDAENHGFIYIGTGV